MNRVTPGGISSIHSMLLGVWVVSGCSPHHVEQHPEAPVSVDGAFKSAQPGVRSDKWWIDLRDATLTGLVDRALKQSLQMEVAWSRLAQAQAVSRQTGAAQWPTVDLNANASEQQQWNQFSAVEGVNFPLPDTFRIRSYAISAAAGYEVDWLRKNGSRAAGAALDAEATRDQLESVAMTLAAQTAETWYELVNQRARLKVLAEQVNVASLFLELARLRLQGGLGSALDVLQQEQVLASNKAQLPLVESSIHVLSNQLAVLLGQAPHAFVPPAGDELPELPPLPASGLPADLVERRPDVRAARRRLVAADYRLAAAIADRLPSLRLQGSYGTQTSKVSDLFASPVWTLVGSVLAPLLDGGRRRAEADRNRSAVRELRYAYGEALLQAMVEVENSLVQEKKQTEHIEATDARLELANKTLDEARARYREGVGDESFLQVLTALRSQQEIELAALAARRQRLAFRIQLYRALGGAWTKKLQRKRAKNENEQSE